MDRIIVTFRLIISSVLMTLSLSAFAEEKTVEWTASEQGYANGTKLNEVEAVIDENTSVIFFTGSGSNPPAYYDSGTSIRVYAGNSMKVQGAGITRIELTFGTGEKNNEISADCGSYTADGIWTGVSDAVTFTIGGTSGQRRIAAITVTYATDEQILPPTVYSIQEFKSLSEGRTAQLYLSDEMNARVLYKSTGEVYLRDKTGAICLTLNDTLYNPMPAHNQHVAGYMTGRFVTDHGLPTFVATDSTLTEYMLFADQVSEPDTSPESIDVEEFGSYYADWVTLSSMHVNNNGMDIIIDDDDMYFTVDNRFGLTEDELYFTPPDGAVINISGIAIPYDGTDQIAPVNIDPYLPVEVIEQPRPLRGDVNQDGKVDISDIVAIINQIAGTATYANADVNDDGKVDISDIVAVINIIAEGDHGDYEEISKRDIIREVVRTVEPAGPPTDHAFKSMTIYFVNGTSLTLTIDQIESITYIPEIGMKIHLVGTGVCLDFLYSQMIKIDYVYEEEIIEDNNVNANWKEFDLSSTVSGNLKYAYRLEYPHLNSNQYSASNTGGNQIVVKETSDYGITYSLEWDNSLIANRWTCYTLHAGNLYSKVTRKDSFKADNEVANSSQLADYAGSGYSRGHLCPSADRLCSQEQNSQTFFLTNMQPQWQPHNGGLWARLEGKVREWAEQKVNDTFIIDTLYIVKAATIGDVTFGGVTEDGIYNFKCNNRLLVPKYFYMALLAYRKATDEYEALGLWTFHQNDSDSNTDYGKYAITIDELERRTGIDFFCNLPDDVEKKVESKIDSFFWGLTPWTSISTKPREAEYEGDMVLEILPTE